MTQPAAAQGALREVAVTAIASGIERHGPDAVGIVLKGVPLTALAAVLHYLFDLSTVEAGTGAAALAGLHALRLAASHSGTLGRHEPER